MIKKSLIIALSLLTVGGFAKLKFSPLPRVVEEVEANSRRAAVDPNIAAIFFEENFVAGGYAYQYPEETSRVLMPEESGKEGEVSLLFDLDVNDYSGGAVVLEGISFDLVKEFPTGALEFWVKGAVGGEQCVISFADEESSLGYKTEIGVPINAYGGIQPYWTFVSIPLADFGTRGSYWDEKADRSIKKKFKWNSVSEFLVVTEKGQNKSFRVWVDNIKIVKDKYPEPKNLYAPYWDEVEEVVENHPSKTDPVVKIIDTLFDNSLKEPLFADAYGGKTVFALQPTDDPTANPKVLALYFDNTDYSGINVNFGKTVDLSKHRETNGGIGMWVKAIEGVDQIFIGITDDKSDKKQVTSTVLLSDYGTLDTNWNYFMIPLKEFTDNGSWWNEDLAMEKPGKMDWTKINEVIFSTDKYANRIIPGDPIKLYVDNIGVLDNVPGYIDPDIYWDKFKSDAPDRLVFDFEHMNAEESGWEAIAGEQSSLVAKIHSQNDRELRGKYGRFYLEFEYSMNDWGYVGYPFARFNSPKEMRDWSKHRAIKFDFHSERDVENCSFKINDAGNEGWLTSFKVKKGWNSVVIPFRKLRKNAFEQEPGANVDGKLDLSNVMSLSFEPKDIGVMSTVIIDNITLTNDSEE